jgi:hypothetical protein
MEMLKTDKKIIYSIKTVNNILVNDIDNKKTKIKINKFTICTIILLTNNIKDVWIKKSIIINSFIL